MVANALRTSFAAAVTAVVLAGCGTDTDPVAEDPTTSAPTGGVTPESTPATPSESSPAAHEPVAVPVYFAADAPQGPRLFREFQSLTTGEPITAAVGLAVAGDPLDPDYRTLWPDGVEATGALEGDVLTVDLSGDVHDRPAGMSEEEASLAVQQLVYTAQAAAGQGRLPVRLLIDGGHTDTVLGVPTSEELANSPELDVLGLVNVTTPEQGAAVADTLEASGVASSFEGTVVIEIRDASGKAVVETFATAEGWMDGLYPWTTTVDVSALAPGEYTFAALTDDPSGGTEGFGPTEDTKTITVR